MFYGKNSIKKTTFSLLAVGIIVLGISGCDSKEMNNKNTAQSEAVTEAAEESTQKTEESDSLAGIKLKADANEKHSFANVSVHDPSVIKVDGTYYIFGSHLAGAKSTDLMNWTLLSTGVNAGNTIIPDAPVELEDALTWAQTDTLWAPDVIQLQDGRFYMYYCACRGDSPLSALGIAVSDNVEGPYKNLGIILKSGMGSDIESEDGGIYNAAEQPNVVDPCVFFDKEGKLWMVYGSYSGGVFILELNPETGFPLETGYGKKLLGENHLRIEAPYIIYSPESEYYYMFLSFGGLAADGGYNIRVCRSKTPDGPYYDSAGNDMINCKGPANTVFDDTAAAEFGAKILGNISFQWLEGENGKLRNGYVSPGHNSVAYDEETGKYFMIFHTRFENRGEAHEVRVHQLFLNEDDWFVAAPYRYIGESLEVIQDTEVVGTYKLINQMRDISSFIKKSVLISLNEDYTVTGEVSGQWKLSGDNQMEITLGKTEYKGVLLKQWDEYGLKTVLTFSALSEDGTSILGSGCEAVTTN
ncbi:glycoside hydrolase family 43 protein [Anaeromicropila populeti]|uniref:Arabinan endo-1,5-alpha-L-arabinosidase n=1 Tax=Anaeromicropila populeti TaxID=37658 RepID=A0A1I6LPC0_9FIRM|nr:glycoside hydrolase family 43 protein [Anaeromicropila populeti]SFS05258.1 arabinan endo-1,5-alpha-L-arabinosidase [Anaeromicropila populeti]